MNVIIFGPPGAGKGTQSRSLTEYWGIAHISTGDLFRNNIANETELGLKTKAYLEAGRLVPDDLTISMLEERLQEPDVVPGFLLDGFPRSEPQCVALERIMSDMGRKIDHVINLYVSDDVVRNRLKGRAGIEGRADDADLEVIEKRIATYKTQTRPSLEYYRPKGVVHDVDGVGTVEEVFDRIIGALVRT